MPQVKELKELGVAGSATNERGRYGSGMALFVKRFFVSASFFVLWLQITNKTVTGYKQRLLQVSPYTGLCSVTCNRLLTVTCNSKLVTGGNCVDPPTI